MVEKAIDLTYPGYCIKPVYNSKLQALSIQLEAVCCKMCSTVNSHWSQAIAKMESEHARLSQELGLSTNLLQLTNKGTMGYHFHVSAAVSLKSFRPLVCVIDLLS